MSGSFGPCCWLRVFCFFWFLSTLINQAVGGLSYNSQGYEQANGLPDNTYSKMYGAFVVVCIISFLGFVYVALMFVKLCEYISTNQTSWEVSKRDRISYLKTYPKGFLPFHMGFWRNWKMTFFHGGILKEWTLIDPNGAPAYMFDNSSYKWGILCW